MYGAEGEDGADGADRLSGKKGGGPTQNFGRKFNVRLSGALQYSIHVDHFSFFFCFSSFAFCDEPMLHDILSGDMSLSSSELHFWPSHRMPRPLYTTYFIMPCPSSSLLLSLGQNSFASSL